MPTANLPGIANNLATSYPTNDSFNQTIDRLDQNIGDKIPVIFPLRMAEREHIHRRNQPVQFDNSSGTARNWAVGYTQTISPTMVNDFRVGRQHLVTNALNYSYQITSPMPARSLAFPVSTATPVSTIQAFRLLLPAAI